MCTDKSQIADPALKGSCIHNNTRTAQIPVNNDNNARLGMSKYSDLCEFIHPSIDHVLLYVITGAESGKGLCGPGGGGVLDISLGGEVRLGPSYPDPV